jgi:hypothetical protein
VLQSSGEINFIKASVRSDDQFKYLPSIFYPDLILSKKQLRLLIPDFH